MLSPTCLIGNGCRDIRLRIQTAIEDDHRQSLVRVDCECEVTLLTMNVVFDVVRVRMANHSSPTHLDAMSPMCGR